MAVKYGKRVREIMTKEIEDLIQKEKGFLFSSYQNIKATEIDAFRKKVKKSGSRHFIIKKRLTKRAVDAAGIEGLEAVLAEEKNVGVTVIKEDPVLIAKILADFSKENPNFSVLSGLLEGKVLNPDQVKALATLPSREQLLAILLGTMNAPVTSFVRVLSGVLRSLLYALNALKDKKEQGGS